jgi:DNA-binding response OmpR family regulator
VNSNNFNVLIVDDDKGIREFLAELCATNGYRADVAANGAEALKIMQRNGSYDLIITDYMMPEMNGAEFVSLARKDSADVPIIAMSACADVEGSLMKAGAYLFLKKPFNPYVLEREIELLTRNTQMTGSHTDLFE